MLEPPIKLDLENAFSVAVTGIIRASIFSGIILNPQNKLAINSWHINESFKLCDNNFNDESKAEAYEEFKKWIVKNSLREMMEYLDYSLSLIYQYLYRITEYPDIVIPTVLAKEIAKFNSPKNGFPDKIKIIDGLLNNTLTEAKDYWTALQKIRNSITHNLGICNKKQITLSIPEVKTIAKTINGKEVHFKPGEPIDTKKYRLDEISIKFDYKIKTYKKDEIINFSNEDIMYIIWGMQQTIAHFEKSILEKAFQMNIPVIDKISNKIIDHSKDFKSNMNLMTIKTRYQKNI